MEIKEVKQLMMELNLNPCWALGTALGDCGAQ
jgi:hypothetical protein